MEECEGRGFVRGVWKGRMYEKGVCGCRGGYEGYGGVRAREDVCDRRGHVGDE